MTTDRGERPGGDRSRISIFEALAQHQRPGLPALSMSALSMRSPSGDHASRSNGVPLGSVVVTGVTLSVAR